jgi:hypothetical protein
MGTAPTPNLPRHTPRNPMLAYKKALAIAIGLLAGGFLYLRFDWKNNSAEFAGWEWYQGAALLGGIGLAGIFPEAWQVATIALAIAPTLIMGVVFYLHPAESMWPIALALIFFFSFPAPLIGSGISDLLKRTRLPRAVYFVALMSALAIGVVLPNIQNARRQRFEIETVPQLLKQIYDAEMIYRARQPGGSFACDGTLLPGAAGKLGWTHSDERPAINKYLRVRYYEIRLDCPNEINPPSFEVTARSKFPRSPFNSSHINETGKLVIDPLRSMTKNGTLVAEPVR